MLLAVFQPFAIGFIAYFLVSQISSVFGWLFQLARSGVPR